MKTRSKKENKLITSSAESVSELNKSSFKKISWNLVLKMLWCFVPSLAAGSTGEEPEN